ncbi:MAG: hypothetical protein QNK37_12295 [Acidobacteriota bacterium]|nr:hypothetical protein [Acidobacteriota bacterium]
MLGKKSGLGSKLRKLLARIQREFDFPKVFAVRVALTTEVHDIVDNPEVEVHSLPDSRPETRDYAVDLTPSVHTGHVTEPRVHLSQSMSEMSTEAHTVTCWRKETLKVGTAPLDIPTPEIHALKPETRPPLVRKRNVGIVSPATFSGALLKPPELHGSRGDAARFPYSLRVIPMNSLPMKLRIRYRASVLKALNLKPNQVDFVGVVIGLPSAPLKLIGVETDTLDGYPRALAAQTGRFNSFMSGRVWVIIQMKNKPDYLTVVLREE